MEQGLTKLIVVQLVNRIPRLLWNVQVHYRVHKSPQLGLILGKLIPSTPTSLKFPLPSRFSDQNFVRIFNLSHAYNIHHPFHPL